MKKTKVLFISSLIFNLILFSLVFVKLGVPYLNNKFNPQHTMSDGGYYYLATVELYNQLEISSQDVVFLGDSLTDRNEWAEFFTDIQIKNRGIDGDTTEQMLNRLEPIIKGSPRKVFILVGTNDLNRNVSMDSTVENYDNIVKKFIKESPNTEIYIQSVLPVNDEMNRSNRKNSDIIALNEEIKEIANSNSVEYIDLFEGMAENDNLIKELTIDGVHLSAEGYRAWASMIESYVYK